MRLINAVLYALTATKALRLEDGSETIVANAVDAQFDQPSVTYVSNEEYIVVPHVEEDFDAPGTVTVETNVEQPMTERPLQIPMEHSFTYLVVPGIGAFQIGSSDPSTQLVLDMENINRNAKLPVTPLLVKTVAQGINHIIPKPLSSVVQVTKIPGSPPSYLNRPELGLFNPAQAYTEGPSGLFKIEEVSVAGQPVYPTTIRELANEIYRMHLPQTSDASILERIEATIERIIRQHFADAPNTEVEEDHVLTIPYITSKIINFREVPSVLPRVTERLRRLDSYAAGTLPLTDLPLLGSVMLDHVAQLPIQLISLPALNVLNGEGLSGVFASLPGQFGSNLSEQILSPISTLASGLEGLLNLTTTVAQVPSAIISLPVSLLNPAV